MLATWPLRDCHIRQALGVNFTKRDSGSKAFHHTASQRS